MGSVDLVRYGGHSNMQCPISSVSPILAGMGSSQPLMLKQPRQGLCV